MLIVRDFIFIFVGGFIYLVLDTQLIVGKLSFVFGVLISCASILLSMLAPPSVAALGLLSATSASISSLLLTSSCLELVLG